MCIRDSTYEDIRKKQEKNISSYWKRVGRRPVYLKAINLFLLLAKGNKLDPRNLFDENNLIKQPIREETVERIAKCESWTRDAIPRIVLEKTGEPATPEFIEGATKSFALWWMSTYETIIKGGK